MINQIVDDFVFVFIVELFGEFVGECFWFVYVCDKEEEVVKVIVVVICQNFVDFLLVLVFLYSMCVEYVCYQMD